MEPIRLMRHKRHPGQIMNRESSDANDFAPMILPDVLQKSRAHTGAAELTIWPQDSGGNGMFIAGWRRVNNQ